MSSYIKKIALATSILTQIPIPKNINLNDISPNSSVKFFPLIGMIIGILSSILIYVLTTISFPPLLLSANAILFQIIITGALHEDGLADCSDSLGATKDKNHKLAIMKDSHIGSYGVISLIFSIILRIFFLNQIILIDLITAIKSIIVIGSLARFNITFQIFSLRPVRKQGLSFLIAGITTRDMSLPIVMGIMITFIFLDIFFSLYLILLNILIAKILSIWSKKHIGGYSGDTLGAVEQISEIILYFLIFLYVFYQ